MISDRGQKTLK